MARQKGMLNLSGNLEPLAGAPLDSRDITPTVADLYIASNWPYKYIGMKTTVTATGDTYRLVNLDVTQESSWVKEGSGESGASNLSDLNDVDLNNPEEGEALLYDGEGGWTNGPAGQTYSDFTGATAQAAGAHGLVPAPTTGDISKFLKGDGTWANVPIPGFDYSNTSPEAMNFSTDEKVIGTWVDGKPLYQKTFTGIKTIARGAIINLSSDIIVRKIEGITYGGVPLNCINNELNNNIFTCANNTAHTIYMECTNNWVNLDVNITLQYTKTTDSAVASGEKIIGQWIDGKPIYQKTWEGLTPSSVGVNSELTDLTSWNIDKIVNMNGSYSDGLAQMSINYYFNEDNYTMTHINQNKKLVMIVAWSTHVNQPVHITLQYTKTT